MSDIKIVDWPKRPAEQRRDELESENAELRKANSSLMFLVKNQRCCRNCGNHSMGCFDICGLGPDTVDGRECRENDLKNWRPMEYRLAKAKGEV